MDRTEPRRRFYVYVLRDAKGEPFYVGKGSGVRALQHLFGRISPTTINTPSGSVRGSCAMQWIIQRAKAEGGSLSIEFVRWFETEDEAFAHERGLIAKFGMRRHGGLLTNRSSGGGGLAQVIAPDEPLPTVA